MVKKELFTFFHCRFTVDVPGLDDLEAKGDFINFLVCSGLCFIRIRQISSSGPTVRMLAGSRSTHQVTGV